MIKLLKSFKLKMHTRNAFNLYTTIKKVDTQIVKDVDTAVVKSVVAVWSCLLPSASSMGLH